MSPSRLRRFIARRNFAEFKVHFDQGMSARTTPPEREQLRQVGAEAFEAFLASSLTLDRELFRWFADHLLAGRVEPSPELLLLAQRHERAMEQAQERARHSGLNLTTPVIQLKRVFQLSWFGLAGFKSSDAFEIRRSIYRSPQESNFACALSLRWPGLQVLPNYPLDQIIDLDRIRPFVSAEAWRRGRYLRVDAVLVVPFEGDPIAGFETDSKLHQDPKVQRLDGYKNELMAAARIPFLRVESEDPSATSIDEWYSLLTDQAYDKVSVGERVRIRGNHTSLVPLFR
jgi:hypothetical protein